MSWIFVIPFDVLKTVVQAEVDPINHKDISQIVIDNINVPIWTFKPSFHWFYYWFLTRNGCWTICFWFLTICFFQLAIWMESVFSRQLDHIIAIIANKFRDFLRYETWIKLYWWKFRSAVWLQRSNFFECVLIFEFNWERVFCEFQDTRLPTHTYVVWSDFDRKI